MQKWPSLLPQDKVDAAVATTRHVIILLHPPERPALDQDSHEPFPPPSNTSLATAPPPPQPADSRCTTTINLQTPHRPSLLHRTLLRRTCIRTTGTTFTWANHHKTIVLRTPISPKSSSFLRSSTTTDTMAHTAAAQTSPISVPKRPKGELCGRAAPRSAVSSRYATRYPQELELVSARLARRQPHQSNHRAAAKLQQQ